MAGRRTSWLVAVAGAALLVACSTSTGAERSAPSGADDAPTSIAGPPTSAHGPAPTSGPAPAGTPATTSAPTSTTAPRSALAGTVISLDPGHNGGNAAHVQEIGRLVDAGNGVTKACDTTGTASDDGHPEHALTLAVAEQVRARLEQLGAEVVMTRTDDAGWGPCITERAAIANAAGAAAAVSIHADGSYGAGHRGFHVIVGEAAAGGPAVVAASDRLGVLVRDAIAATGMPASTYLGVDGIDRRGDLGGLNLTTVPKVFVEMGNMRHPDDLALLLDPAWQAELADALTSALVAFATGG